MSQDDGVSVRKTREELKAYFRNGCRPDQEHFAALIEALALRDELPPPVPEQLVPEYVAVSEPEPVPVPASQERPDPRPVAPPAPDALPVVRGSVLADGGRYVIAQAGGCKAWRVVAAASGASDSKLHAVTHAIVLFSEEGSRGGIRQACSYRGWDWRRRIRLRWGDEFGQCVLTVGTGVDFGVDDGGRPVLVQYTLSRLW